MSTSGVIPLCCMPDILPSKEMQGMKTIHTEKCASNNCYFAFRCEKICMPLVRLMKLINDTFSPHSIYPPTLIAIILRSLK